MPEHFASIGEAIGSAMRHNARMAADLATAQRLASTPARVGPVPASGNAEDCPRCVCGDPIEWMDHPDDPGWVHSPGSDTPCLDARPAAPGVWIDGDPLMEAIAAAVWEQCRTEGTSTVRDDPRNIAAAAARAIQYAEAQSIGDDTAIREALLVLLSRTQRGVLVEGEGDLLRQHVEHLLVDRDRLTAALARVQAVADRLDAGADRIAAGTVHPVAAHIRAAVDSPADTTPEA